MIVRGQLLSCRKAQSEKMVRLAQDGVVVSMHGADDCMGQLHRSRKVFGWAKTGWCCGGVNARRRCTGQLHRAREVLYRLAQYGAAVSMYGADVQLCIFMILGGTSDSR